MVRFDPRLYLITDGAGRSEEEFLTCIEQAILGGVTLVQLREKEKSTREYIELARKAHEMTRRHGVPLLINDRVDVALAVGAEGVHVGQSDMPVDVAKRLLGEERIVGATAKTLDQAREACAQGADYLGVGAIYPTSTKSDAAPTSIETLRAICAAVSVPVSAIGGLNRERLDILKGVPLSGVCVSSAIMHADDPGCAACELRARAQELGLC